MPNMQLYICKGIPTDKTYNHVLRFQSDSSRFAYFTSKSVLHLTNYTYQRLEHYLSVGVNAETIEPCNYIVFQNADFSDKWYYAFIDSVEYVANETSRIYFTVDVMQTWFNQVVLQACFIERSHVNNDTFGKNLVPESFDTGPYIDKLIKNIDFDKQICIVTTFDGTGDSSQPAQGNNAYGIYAATKENYFNSVKAANDFIAAAVKGGQAPDGILGIYMVPKTASSGKYDKTYELPKNIDGYVPKNNKLFTYPYNYLRFYSSQGDNHVYKFELKNQFKGSIDIGYEVMSRGGQTTALFAPYDYAGVVGANTEDVFALSNWPMCSYNTDIYKVYLAQNASSLAVQNAGMFVNTAFSALNIVPAVASDKSAMAKAVKKNKTVYPSQTVNAVEGFVDQGFNVANVLAQRIDMDRLPPQNHGSISPYFVYTEVLGDNNLPGTDCAGPVVRVSYRQITAEFAKIIDNYWSMYGYPIHEVQIPNIDSRLIWNYVKTANFICLGDIPPEAADTIAAVFNHGVTFWHDPRKVGNYTLDNPITKRIPEVGE